MEYQNLPGGEYTFEVHAVDRDLSYSEVPVRVSVKVHLPYRMIGFWSAVILAFSLGTWQIAQVARRGQKLREARDELEQRVEERTTELAKSSNMLRESEEK